MVWASKNFLIFFGLAALALLLLPRFVSLPTVRLMSTVFYWSLLAMSLDVLLGYLGVISFAQFAIAGVGGYSAALLILYLDVGFWTALAFGVLMSTVFSVVLGVLSTRLRDIYFGIITLVSGIIVIQVLLFLQDFSKGDDGLRVIRPAIELPFWGQIDWRGVDGVVEMYYFGAILLLLVYLFARRLVNSPLGKVFRDIKENENRTQAMGYNVKLYKIIAFAFSGVIAGFGGVLFAFVQKTITPFDLNPLNSGLVVLFTLVGGLGTLAGPLFGAGLMKLLEDVFRSWTENFQILTGLVFVAVVIFSPRGLAGYAGDFVRALSKKRSSASVSPVSPPPTDVVVKRPRGEVVDVRGRLRRVGAAGRGLVVDLRNSAYTLSAPPVGAVIDARQFERPVTKMLRQSVRVSVIDVRQGKMLSETSVGDNGRALVVNVKQRGRGTGGASPNHYATSSPPTHERKLSTPERS